MKDKEEVKTRRRKMPVFSIILTVICIMAVGASFFFYKMYRDSNAESDEQKQIAAHISEVLEVPQEEPTLVTVADKARLSNKQLADKVNDGDVLVIYPQAQRLVVYRPSSSKIADVLTFQGQAPAQQDQTSNLKATD